MPFYFECEFECVKFNEIVQEQQNKQTTQYGYDNNTSEAEIRSDCYRIHFRLDQMVVELFFLRVPTIIEHVRLQCIAHRQCDTDFLHCCSRLELKSGIT